MKKYIVCVLVSLIFCGVVFAQEKNPATQAEKLYEEANNAYTNKEYAKAIPLYLEAMACPEASEWRATILYNVSCCYSLLGIADSAFEYLDQSIRAGNTDYRWIKKDTDFSSLGKNHPKEFEEMILRARAARKNEILTKSPIAVVECSNYNGSTEITEYFNDSLDSPEMDSLRNRYQLRRVVESGKTEFEKMKLLLDWVANRWKHNGDNMAIDRSALAILKAAEKGERFCCANYADVLVGCMKALGYPAHFVGLRRDDAAYYMGGGHGCIEVWSNQYQKWILLDGQNNAWWESGGLPLSAYECHQLLVSGKEDEMKFVGQHKQVDYDHIKPDWSVHFYRVVCYWRGVGFELVSDTIAPDLFLQGSPVDYEITDDYTTVYPRLNQTKITLKHTNLKAPSDTLDVVLTHTMPCFDKFMVRINGSDWKESKDTFRWVLDKGDNIIEAKAVNLAGIEGRPSSIVLRNNIETSGE